MRSIAIIALLLSSFSIFASEEKKEDHSKEKEACLKENKDLKDKALDECVAKKVEEEKKEKK